MAKQPKVVTFDRIPKGYWSGLKKRVRSGTASSVDVFQHRSKEARDRMDRPPGGRRRWLLDFLNWNLEDLREGEWTDLAYDVWVFPHVWADSDVLGVTTAWSIGDEGVPREEIRRLQASVQQCLEQARRPMGTQYNSGGATWDFRTDPEKKTLEMIFRGQPHDSFVLTAMMVAKSFWDRLKRCPACSTWFPGTGRKDYCSPRCSQQVRSRRYWQNRRDKDRQRRKERTA